MSKTYKYSILNSLKRLRKELDKFTIIVYDIHLKVLNSNKFKHIFKFKKKTKKTLPFIYQQRTVEPDIHI